MSDKTKAIIAILAGSIISGAISPVTKIGLVKIPPFTFSFLRFFLASVVILPLYLKKIGRIDKSFLWLIALSLLPILNVALFVLGVRSTTAGVAQMLYAGTPIFAGIFAYLLLRNKLPIKKWLFILVGLAGVFLVVLLPLLEKDSLFSGDFRGNFLISIGVILYSLYTTVSKSFQKKYSPFIITSTFILLATVFFFLLALVEFKANDPWWSSLTISSAFSILYVGIPATLIGYTLHQYAIKYGGPVLASLSLYLIPIFAYFSSFILLGEKLTMGLIIGTVLVFASVALSTYSK